MDQQDYAREEQQKLQDAYLLRYRPQAGRADKLASNIPGESAIGSVKGTAQNG